MTAVTKKLLLDVQEAAQSILKHTSSRSLIDYSADRFFRRAVEREFEIVGEALNRLERTNPEASAQIIEIQRIINFRNRIIHGYDTVDDIVVWGISEKHLPLLEREVSTLLQSDKYE